MLRIAASKVMWVGRARSAVVGLAMILALVVLASVLPASLAEAQEGRQDQVKKAPLSSSQAAKGQARVIPHQYIVVLKDQAVERAVQAVSQNPAQAAEQASAQVADDLARNKGIEITQTYGNALKGFAAKIPAGRLNSVRSDPRVDFVAQDREVRAAAQSLPFGINRADADVSSTKAGNGSGAVKADVAVIDTGIYKHTDLNVSGGYNCTTTTRRAWGDGNGHGTHVAGTVAARDNTTGVVGAAPGARLWAIKVLDSQGSGTWSSVICGVNRVTAMNKDSIATNNIEVANMSLGGRATDNGSADDGNCGRTNNDPVHKAICTSVAAKVTYVVAAGNDGSNVSDYIPASYNEVITVSALADYNGLPDGSAANTCFQDGASDDDIAYFSNYGADVDLGAPGVCIKSTWKGGGYKTISGTSMASPHVAGAAALYKSRVPAATPSQVSAFMKSAANSEAEGQGHFDSIGLNPERVLQMDNY